MAEIPPADAAPAPDALPASDAVDAADAGRDAGVPDLMPGLLAHWPLDVIEGITTRTTPTS